MSGSVVTTFDVVGDTTTFRITGTVKTQVEAELARMEAVLSPDQKLWVLGPVLWGHEWIAYGEIGEK